jgi:hypothetical protein
MFCQPGDRCEFDMIDKYSIPQQLGSAARRNFHVVRRQIN